MKAEDYFRQQILAVFPGGNTAVSVEPFPELNQIARKQLGLSPDDGGNNSSARTEAIRARVKFQKDGKDLEDWVTLVVVTGIFRQGQGAFYDCHAIDVTALRAPQGQLDANDKLLKVMISSIRPEPKWQAYSNGVIAKLSNLYDHAWLNGSNEYIMSDDPNFNPNGQPNGNWNQLQVVRPAR
jgi:hypothetical protein